MFIAGNPRLMSSSTSGNILFHILSQLRVHRRIHSEDAKSLNCPPLFVALQGPQGSGKTYLTTQLKDLLTQTPHSLAVVVVSVDDFYLPHTGLKKVAESHPGNALLAGRGQPGTHDLALGKQVLRDLAKINEPGAKAVQLPVFEKSLFNGEGDRVASNTTVHRPLDIVILEGWCVGFYPITDEEIDKRYELPVEDIKDQFDLKAFRKEDIRQINEILHEYIDWWSFFDVFIQIKPPDSYPHLFIYKWRLQQEHNMKAKNGGKGMSDERVERFIDRYIPGYVFFCDGIQKGFVTADNIRKIPKWISRSLQVTINEDRELVSSNTF